MAIKAIFVGINKHLDTTIAEHKALFFVEKDTSNTVIVYAASTQGHPCIVPKGQARQSLADDYGTTVADAVMVGDAPPCKLLGSRSQGEHAGLIVGPV